MGLPIGGDSCTIVAKSKHALPGHVEVSIKMFEAVVEKEVKLKVSIALGNDKIRHVSKKKFKLASLAEAA